MSKLPKYYGFAGLGLIIASFLYWYVSYGHFTLLVFNFLFYSGNILFFDFLSYHFAGFSLLSPRHRHIRLLVQLLLIGFVFGLMLELYVHWFGKLWYYPFWSFGFYLLIFVPGFAYYSLYLIESYLGTKAVIEKFLLHYRRKKLDFRGLKGVFTAAGLIGAIGLGGATVYTVLKTTFGTTFEEFVSVTNSPSQGQIPLWLLILISLFIWLVFEFLEYERHESSMLYELFKGNFAPILAVFIAAWISALLYEIFNEPGGLWRYENIPYSEITILNVPILVYLIWPFHYLPLFSLYRILFKKDTEEIWK